MWAQKVQCEWYNWGDKNTKYFHRRTNGRKKANDDNGHWSYDTDIFKSRAANFYKDLFFEKNGGRVALLMNISYSLIEQCTLSYIGSGVSNAEVEAKLKVMGSLKALGPNRINPLFFHSQWDKVKCY